MFLLPLMFLLGILKTRPPQNESAQHLISVFHDDSQKKHLRFCFSLCPMVWFLMMIMDLLLTYGIVILTKQEKKVSCYNMHPIPKK